MVKGKKRVLVVFGTRPEAIKMSPVIHELRQREHSFDCIVCVTAQHREMLDQVLEWFEIVPEYDLNIMKHSQDLFDITISALLGMRKVLSKSRPDVVLVHGDTTTSTAATLAAFYMKIPVGHVEAGLRTHNMYSPYPEEINRQLTSRMASFHFSPTESNRANLLQERVPVGSVFVTGNTVIDALLWTMDKIKSGKFSGNTVIRDIVSYNYAKLILVTAHRRESFGKGFENICNALRFIAIQNPDTAIVYPVHPNPNVTTIVNEMLGEEKNIYLIPPMDYQNFVYLMSVSDIILTDSGGVQEEAPSLGKPVLVMREVTERLEGLESGTIRLVGTDPDKIVNEVSSCLAGKFKAEGNNPYGNGSAASRIADILEENI
ncbi:non-hydrolyzing UDP-N-acetylglucosamine 2-epimerase [Compostibacter hankyongensis]|uniref:UDP-N-acetylglucosamine 2-epimerase (non-hydrolyzing) n=1 Tax=Compostibacter hankyongensis TaxID=1007089 RepID=A0ABP8FVA6_9BACT